MRIKVLPVRIAVISPHRDDAAFSLGLSIERWLRDGHRVHVLNCFTQSENAPYSDADALHPNDRVSFVSALRKREDAAWNKLLGGGLQITDLDLLDAPLRLACSVDEVMDAAIRPGDRAVARVAGAIAKLARAGASGDLAIALPLALGGHIDHRVTRQAGLEALAEVSLPIAFYEDLPYAVWETAAESIPNSAESTALELQIAFAERGTDDPAPRASRKRRMAECYDSQFDSQITEQIASFCERYEGRERLWANAAWLNSALAYKDAETSA